MSPAASTVASVLRERALVLGREADDHVARQVELACERLETAEVGGDRVAAAHRAQHAVVARLERDVQVPRDGRRLAERGDEVSSTWLISIELSRSRSSPGVAPTSRTRRGRSKPAARSRKQPRLIPVRTTSRWPCVDAPATSRSTASARAAARCAADERDHAEPARERAAVLDLDERPHPVEPRVGLDAADRADVAGDERGGLLGAARDDGDVRRAGRRARPGEVRGAAGQVDAFVACARRGQRPCGSSRRPRS